MSNETIPEAELEITLPESTVVAAQYVADARGLSLEDYLKSVVLDDRYNM